jgi:MOSC domain-containing protein YiiM
MGKGASEPPRVTLLLISATPRAPSEPVAELQMRLNGIVADRHAGLMRSADARTPWHPRGAVIANTRQVTIVSAEECAALAGLLGIAQVDPGSLGANLMVQGLPALSSLMPATRLQFPSGATIFVTDQNQPCRHPGRLLALQYRRSELQFAFSRLAVGRRGLVGIVEREGGVRTGDHFMVIKPRRTLLAERHE